MLEALLAYMISIVSGRLSIGSPNRLHAFQKVTGIWLASLMSSAVGLPHPKPSTLVRTRAYLECLKFYNVTSILERLRGIDGHQVKELCNGLRSRLSDFGGCP